MGDPALLHTCEFVDNRHTPDPEQVLWDIADTISRTGSLIFRDTSAGVVFGPEHAQLLAAADGQADVQAALTPRRPRAGQTMIDAERTGVLASSLAADCLVPQGPAATR